MTASVTCAPLTGLESIGLEELVERAALQTRVDRKYLLPVDVMWDVLDLVDPTTRVLEIDGARSFAYQSTYFDTPDLTSYLLTAQRRRRRFKIRTRTYLDSSLCWLEVKTRGARGNTVKDRLPYQTDHENVLTPGLEFVESVLARESIPLDGPAVFVPTLVTRYRRSTLFLPATTSRVTVDTELIWQDTASTALHLPDLAVVETKTGSTASAVDRLLWARGHRPIRISKYATGLAALRPDLPAAPWRRTLRRHFVPPTSLHRHHCLAPPPPDGRHAASVPPSTACHTSVAGPARPLEPETE
ncbi:polyphosphate polymerase domain-containing protein [Plantactinospora sonchi]|uniref:Polyphosphate polymerase domain-containing protein n=1 Tax=Plantactinospora sonchi TaxID=1544735 RepID=A0ABU7RWW9_9ACTN